MVSRLVYKLSDSQKKLLSEIAECKYNNDKEKLENLIDKASIEDIDSLLDRGFISQNNGETRMHRLLIFCLGKKDNSGKTT